MAAAKTDLIIIETLAVPEGRGSAGVPVLPPVTALERAPVGHAALVDHQLIDVAGEVVNAEGADAALAGSGRLALVEARELRGLGLRGEQPSFVDPGRRLVDAARLVVADMAI